MSRMISSTGEMEPKTEDYMVNPPGYLGEGKLTCKYCARPFECQLDLNEHLKEHKTNYQCYVCNKVYTTPSKLQRHARVHSGEKPFGCDVCGKKFARSDHLKQHNKIHTPGDEKMKNFCRMCRQNYNMEYHLSSHLMTVHNVKSINACTKCGETFDDKEKLKLHMTFHKDPSQNSANGIDTNDDKTMSKLVQDSLGPVNPSKDYIIGVAKFVPPSKSDLNDSDDDGENNDGLKKPAKRKKVAKNSSTQDEGSTMVDNDENMFILQNALQGMKGESDQFEFETLDGNDIEALGDKALLEEISEDIDPEKGAVPVHLEAGTHQIDENHKVTEIVVFPKPGAKVTTYDKPVTSMTAYEDKIIKGPTVKTSPKIQHLQVDPKKLIGPASFKAKMKKKIESNYPYPQNQGANSLQHLVYNVGLDPNTVSVGSTDKLQQEINARTVAKKKADADKVTGKGMFKCKHCCIYFEDQTMSLLHKALHNADDADPFTCRKCLKKLGNRLEFTAHLIWHLEPGMEG